MAPGDSTVSVGAFGLSGTKASDTAQIQPFLAVKKNLAGGLTFAVALV